jgi:hypothetical protein
MTPFNPKYMAETNSNNSSSGLLALIIILVAIIIIGAIYVFATNPDYILQEREIDLNMPNTDDAADSVRNTFNTIIPGFDGGTDGGNTGGTNTNDGNTTDTSPQNGTTTQTPTQ